MRKVTVIGGGGLRTPLLIYGLAQAQAQLELGEVALFDIDGDRLDVIAKLCQEILRQFSNPFQLRVANDLEGAAASSSFVLNSIRVGGMAARARDERIAIQHGFAGQETTGPGGAAMALRTLPITLGHARIIERVAASAWFINFTNPAGLITQALTQNTKLRVVGICDTPIELFHRIAGAFGEPVATMSFDYAGLNHLGWIRRVTLRGTDITDSLLRDAELLRGLYSAELFDPDLIQTLGLIPTEYLFFYYSQQRARDNQLRAGASRGEELDRLNLTLFQNLRAADGSAALNLYRDYLARRNASYMKLEAHAGSAFSAHTTEDPFDTATGYHRVAVDVMTALLASEPREIVVNVPNAGAISDLQADDVIEAPCAVSAAGISAKRIGHMPEAVRGLVQSVKAYERTTIRASLAGSRSIAQLALLEYPIIGQWENAKALVDSLVASDPLNLGYLH